MKFRKLARYFAIPALALTLPLCAGVNDTGNLNGNNDHGFWLKEKFISHLSKQAYVNLSFEQRWGNDYRTFWYHHYQIIGQFDFAPYIKSSLGLCPDTCFRALTFGPGFKEAIFIQRNSHQEIKWASANIPLLEANLTFNLFGGLFRQRFRGEYMNYNTKHYHDYGLFRYRLYYFTPWRWGKIEFNPWVSNEFFFREETKKGEAVIQTGVLFENRFRVGANARLFERFFVDFFWQWRKQSQLRGTGPLPGHCPHWVNNYQIGANAIYIF